MGMAKRARSSSAASRKPLADQASNGVTVSSTAKCQKQIAGPSVHSCQRCVKLIHNSRDPDCSTQCPSCSAWYHTHCYLVDIGKSKEERHKMERHDKSPCVACLSGRYNPIWFVDGCAMIKGIGAPRGWLRYRNRFSDAAWAVAACVLRDGFAVFPLWLKDKGQGSGSKAAVLQQLTELRSDVRKYFKALMHSYERHVSHAEATGASVVSLATGYNNFRMRCAGRYEMVAPFLQQRIQPLLATAFILEVMQIVLHCDVPKPMSAGCFYSMAGADGQNLHTDGPTLCDQVNLFPYAINCFAPLVNVNQANGTEFHPQTHLKAPWSEDPQRFAASDGDPDGTLPELASPPLPTKVAPVVPLGHVLLFDYRVVHRGLPNKCGDDRPCVYATFAQPWYEDTYNFGAKRYGASLEVSDVFLESREERQLRRQRETHGGTS